MSILIDDEIAESILDFLRPRPHIPVDIETNIVEKQKNFFKKKLLGKIVLQKNLVDLKNTLEKTYYNMIMQPGETVGIICGQCIGEKTTQSSLNNFHSAGLDTGCNSQIDSLQNIINASKIKKTESRKCFKVSLFLKKPSTSLRETKLITCHYLEEIKFKNLIENVEYENIELKNDVVGFTISGNDGGENPVKSFCNFVNFFFNSSISDKNLIKISLKLEKIYFYRISRKLLLGKIPIKNKFCLPYSLLDSKSTVLDLYLNYNDDQQLFELLQSIREITIIGIDSVKSHIFNQSENGEWYVNCLSNSMSVFFKYDNIYDTNKIICTSMFEMYTNFGILMTQEVIIKKCEEIIPEIDSAHFKILAMRMTRNGFLEPLNRYTMRSNSSPLTKASFEESFETCLKAGKYKEKEKFKSVSSAIICGKKPKIGTYNSDVFIDKNFYFQK